MPNHESMPEDTEEQQVVDDRHNQKAAQQGVKDGFRVMLFSRLRFPDQSRTAYGITGSWSFHHHVDCCEGSIRLGHGDSEAGLHKPVAHCHLRIDIDKSLFPICVGKTQDHGVELGRVALPNQHFFGRIIAGTDIRVGAHKKAPVGEAPIAAIELGSRQGHCTARAVSPAHAQVRVEFQLFRAGGMRKHRRCQSRQNS